MPTSNRLPILSEKIERRHLAAGAAAKRSLCEAIACGEALAEAKALVKHGE